MRGTNERLDHVESSLGHVESSLGARIDETNDRLGRLAQRQTESETRLAAEIVAVAGAVNRVREMLAERLDLRDRVDEHEPRLGAIEQRLGT